MGDSIKLYFRYIGISIRGQMQYRASFLMLALGQFFITAGEFMGILALFHRFGSLRGWQLPEVALFYGITHVAFSIADAAGRGFDIFPAMVKSGDFDRLLLRPRSTALQVAAQEMQMMRIGHFLQGFIVLLWAAASLKIDWTADKLALTAGAIAGGACIFYGLFVLQATLSFWTIESLEIMNTVTYGGEETAQYPLTIYRPWFRRFFTFVVPLASMNYIPVSAVLSRPGLSGPASWASWLSPLVGLFFLTACLQVWKVGVRHYRSTGS